MARAVNGNIEPGHLLSCDHWLHTNAHTLFRLDDDGKISRDNDLVDQPTPPYVGPALWLASSEDSVLLKLHTGVGDTLAEQITSLASTEPPFIHSRLPIHLQSYLSLLRSIGRMEDQVMLIYEIPHAISYSTQAELVSSESEQGQALIQSWTMDGIPQPLRRLGFRVPSDIWRPWCAVMLNGEVVSIAFAARLSQSGAELGLATLEEHRGCGFGAAATAAWAGLDILNHRTLFYSADRDNASSLRVTERLGLKLKGTSLRIDWFNDDTAE